MAEEFVHGLFNLSAHRAFVTGASSGLGRHFAQTLARAGAAVAVAARRTDRLAETVAAIQEFGGRAVAIAMDVTRRESVCAAMDDAAARIGTIDVLVNNAGISDTRRALDYTDQDWDAIVGTNLKGAWIVAQEAARRMVAAGTGGSIINITSILADRVAGGVSPYCAAKAGLGHLTRALALELARHDICVNSLAPGYVSTELNAEFLSGEAGDRLRARIPQRIFGQYADLDAPLLLLATAAGRYMTGTQIVVDGGHLCSTL
jgi:NAD(P)-dependent dehydrogenase (short-subunit alcohol dehydrogenase family)